MIFKNVFSILAILAVSVFTFSSCDKDDEPTPDPTGRVMVVHASPDAPSVDLLVDNSKVNSAALSYPNNTGYLAVKTGTRNIKVNAAGTSTNVINVDFVVDTSKNYTVFAIDVLSKITVLAVEDDLTTPAEGKSHLRVFHFIPDAPAVDILINGTVAISNVTFKEGTNFIPVDAGTYNIAVNVANTNTNVFTVPGIVLANKKIYTVFARGLGISGASVNTPGATVIANN